MQSNNEAPAYSIWGVDKVVYGPVDLPMLVNWVQEERVTADSWIHRDDTDAWQKAARLPELKMFFQEGRTGHTTAFTLGGDALEQFVRARENGERRNGGAHVRQQLRAKGRGRRHQRIHSLFGVAGSRQVGRKRCLGAGKIELSVRSRDIEAARSGGGL